MDGATKYEMTMRSSVEPPHIALTEAERVLVRQEVSRIVGHLSFRNSERCTKLLRYLVETALSDNPVHLKERTIGHEVFGRDASYETGADPVVRNAASEIRKRLAQYYQAADVGPVVHIDLVPGSYTPEFHFPSSASLDEPEHDAGVLRAREVAEPPPGLYPAPPKSEARPLLGDSRPAIAMFLILLSAVFCTGAAVYMALQHPANSAVNRFWGPVFSSKRELVIGMGNQPANQPVEANPSGNPTVALVDATSYARILGLMEVHEQRSRKITSESITYDDLRDRPVVLIGGFNNEWTLRLTSGLRYRFGRENNLRIPHETWIEDTMSPDKRRWEVRWTPNFKDWTVDYAIAGRVKDPTTGGPVYYAAGVGSHATQAAAQFITQEKYLSQLPKSLENPDKSIEIVLKMDVLNGATGPPQMVASYVW
jgi:hypothetical protein